MNNIHQIVLSALLFMAAFVTDFATETDSFAAGAGSYECLIRPSQTVRLGAPVSGVVAELTVERGDMVEAGAVVARLESVIQRAAVKAAEVRSGSQAELRAARARVKMLEKRLKRNRELKTKKYVATASVEEIETELEVAQNDIEKAQLNLDIAAAELEAARAEVERRQIRSPVSGYVVERNIEPGEYWNEDKPIVTIATVDPLHVETFVDIAAHGSVVEDMTAVVRPEEPVGGAHKAVVAVVDRVYDAASGTVGVRLDLPNPDGNIPAGIKCEVSFDFGS